MIVRRLVRSTVAVISAHLLVACAQVDPIDSATELAEALRAKGVSFDSQAPLTNPALRNLQIDEAVVLTGESLHIEILRIEDRRTFDLTSKASGILVVAEAKAGLELPGRPDIFSRHPFVIVVRQEPVRGETASILEEVLPQPAD